MERLSSVEVKMKNQAFFLIKGLYAVKGEINLIYGYSEKRFTDEIIISGIRINPQDLTIKGEVTLGNVKAKGDFYTGVEPLKEFFTINYAVDSSRLYLVTYPIQKKTDPKEFSFVVLNPDLSKLYSREIVLDVQSKFADIESTTLDQFGNFYVQRRTIPIDVKTSAFDKEDQKYVPDESKLTHYSKDEPAGTEMALGLNGKFVHQAKITINKATRQLDIAGTYKNAADGKISGIFYCHYDPRIKKPSGLVSSEVDGSVVEALVGEKLAKNSGKNPGLSLAFTIQNVSYRPNGSVDCILEYQNATQHYNLDAARSIYVRYYNFSILNVNITSSGKMSFTRIPKRQLSPAKDYHSFFSFYQGNNLVLIYNENHNNLNKALDEMPDEIEPDKRSTVLAAAIINEKGEFTREVIYEHKDDKYVTMPKNSRMISGHDILITKMKESRIGEWYEYSKIGVLHVL
jgi:hypothetical protein